ncbi:uncharacterized protein DUF4020 [Humibacillus xanthopallidus]|uniref:Uncharacterized protein DUF4020 n=1 Tax=Humibacillus xanthopallidus TaxID=412689 RepID=A0A543PUH9_9MICO|nr:SIR2 family protein [Humibacillus xanthopallidus]TQN47723.1 uncharacterized protein DUF4020 [Humibacillus xanthopallidus]
MLLGGVQIPAAVITAWEEGRLVLFTGAGVSMATPSDLPSFLGLAQEVAERLQSPLNPTKEKWSSQLDTFMDVVDQEEGADVHGHVKRIVTREGSLPNANHDALARIATRFSPRVVTTNYDRHLETRLREHENPEHPLEVFRAPAMPLGHDFEGLVYLHGSAQDDGRRLVVTDRDFSGAYFHSAWAARFLERMFHEYVVLFVGYSHSDVVMKYLGLGLGPKAQRYVLTDKPYDAIWDRLLITAVEYPEGEHGAVTRCLAAWADYGDRGLLDHRQRIRELVSTAAEPDPDELSYLEDSLQREDRVDFFCEFASDNVWLRWAATQEPFKKLFDRAAEPSKVTDRLAYWFADQYAVRDDADIEEEHRPSALAWTTYAEAGGTLSSTAWNAMARRVNAFKVARPAHVVRWLWVLMHQEHANCVPDFLDYALQWANVSEHQDLSLALLAHLMNAYPAPESGWGSMRMGVKTRGKLHWLDEAWAKNYRPDIKTLAPVVFPVVEAALLKHLNLEAQFGPQRRFLRRRSAIQPHEQDDHRDPIDAVIDAVRDSAVALWATDEQYVGRLIERWLATHHVMLHRIAVHVAGAAPGATSDELVRFVLDHELQIVEGVSQEIMHLLGSATPGASSELIDRLVSAWAPEGDNEDDLHTAFSRLEWLERSKVDNPSLTAALLDLRGKLPQGIKGSPYPGMTSWMETGSGDGPRPLTVDEFDKRILANPADAVEFVVSFEERTFPRTDESSRANAISMLAETVKNRASAGLELWPHLTKYPDLQGAVISAWGHAVEQDDAGAIMDVLAETDLEPVIHSVGQFLIHAGGRGGARWEKLPSTDTFVEHVWNAAETDEVFAPAAVDDRDWVSRTINTPAGLLMEFWFEMFRRRWATAVEVDAWRGMGQLDRTFLERALSDRTERGALALTQIAGRLHFLDSADSAWCRAHLLPLRDWLDKLTAEPFWWGVLSFARWNRGLVAGGLLDGLLETVDHLDVFPEDQRHRWASMLASIAVLCEAPPADTWVDKMTSKAGLADRMQWLGGIAEELRELDDEAGREAVWCGWLAAYWRRRTEGDPVTLAKDEADAFAAVAPHVPSTEFPSAVTLVVATNAGLGTHADVAGHVSHSLLEDQPREVGHFLTHLMKNTSLPFYGHYDLEPKLRYLVSTPGDWKALREAALRLDIKLD